MNTNEKQEVIASIKSILKNNRLMSLSTSNNNYPFICNAYYVEDNKFNLYYWSEKTAQHSLNIEKNNKIAISIANSTQKWGTKLKGLKIYGTVEIAKSKDLLSGGLLYVKKFSGVGKWIKKVTDFNKLSSRLYKIKPKKIILLDESKFGKEEYKELIL